jgi:hypothetical protein
VQHFLLLKRQLVKLPHAQSLFQKTTGFRSGAIVETGRMISWTSQILGVIHQGSSEDITISYVTVIASISALLKSVCPGTTSASLR